LETALTFGHDAEGNMIIYIEITDALDWNTVDAETAVDKNIDFVGLTQPVVLVNISNGHAALTDIYYPGNVRLGIVRECNDKFRQLIAGVFSPFNL
jgi:hypothetical protein